MADQEQVERLKRGVAEWNDWRETLPKMHGDVRYPRHTRLIDYGDITSLRLIDSFSVTGPSIETSLISPKLNFPFPGIIDLSQANLSNASLRSANLRFANLCGTNLREADLTGANLSNADLSGADLSGADLTETNFTEANLSGVKLYGAHLNTSLFAWVDLSAIEGLDTVIHHDRSIVDVNTVKFPEGETRLHFLRSIGFSDAFIDAFPSLLTAALQYASCFISYAHQDEFMAQHLYTDLQNKGVRCWFAPEDLRIGDRFHSRINEAIHLQDKLLLLLSESAIQSDWVEIEVRVALEKEQRQRRDVLFPVRLDSSVMETSQAWAAMLRQSRHIGDFTNWTDPQAYHVAFTRLLDDLKKTNERQDQERKQ